MPSVRGRCMKVLPIAMPHNEFYARQREGQGA